jgi:long-chain acyl-CoA synthetase
LEGVYSRSKFVRQIFVYGDSLKHYLIAIIVPNEKYAMDWAKESGLKDVNDFSQLCRHPALKRKVFDDLMRASQAQRVRHKSPASRSIA